MVRSGQLKRYTVRKRRWVSDAPSRSQTFAHRSRQRLVWSITSAASTEPSGSQYVPAVFSQVAVRSHVSVVVPGLMPNSAANWVAEAFRSRIAGLRRSCSTIQPARQQVHPRCRSNTGS